MIRAQLHISFLSFISLAFICYCTAANAVSSFSLLWSEANDSLIAKDWEAAHLVLTRLSKGEKLTPRQQYSVNANHAWVLLQLGLKNDAKEKLNKIEMINYSPSILESASVEDTKVAILLDGITDLPPIHERIIYSTSISESKGMSDLTFQVGSTKEMQEWVEQQIINYLTPRKIKEPFLKPQAPKMTRGEFEKSKDFIRRVEVAQKQYLEKVQKLQEKLIVEQEAVQQEQKQKLSHINTVRRQITQVALNKYMEDKRFNLNRYEADPEVFTGTIGETRSVGDEVDYRVVISVPHNLAKQLKPKLTDAEPILVFRLKDNKLLLHRVLLQLPDNEVRVAQIDDAHREDNFISTYEVPEVGFKLETGSSSISSIMQIQAATEVLALSIDPEILHLKKELITAKQKFNKNRIKSLQKEINQLESKWKNVYDDDLPKLLKSLPSQPTNRNNYAIVIGISKYANTLNVEYSDRSARFFAKVANKILGVPKNNVIELYDNDATGSTIKTRTAYMGKNLKADNRLYFYYAGHGIPAQSLGGEPYILPHDMSPGFASEDEDMMLSNIFASLTSSGEGSVIAFIDSCFSGNSDNRLIFEGVAPGVIRRKNIRTSEIKNLLVFSAGNEKQFANYYPEKGHRLFSYYLLHGLINGVRSPEKLHKYIQNSVKGASLLRGPEFQQTPQLNGRLSTRRI